MPEHLVEQWPMWRLIKMGMATMTELSRPNGWTLGQVYDAIDVLDLYDQASLPEE